MIFLPKAEFFKKKHYLVLVLFHIMVISVPSFAQTTGGTVSGVIINEKNKEPIGFANVILADQQSGNNVKSAQTTDNGNFSFSGIENGTYILKISFVGYKAINKENIKVTGSNSVNLGNIGLEPGDKVLDEVVVVGTPSTMQVGIDRKIFNVAQSTISVGGNATDLLANVPSLQVDIDGGVSLRGSTSVRILIDGKESAMAGNDITQLLQAMPASSIDRIEVITNPSSKYDAEGQSGIINIVLKKDIKHGLNGAINTSAGSYDNYNAGLNLNYRDKKFNYFGNYSFNRRNNVGNGINNTTLFSNESITNSNTDNNRLGLNHGVGLGMDYYISQKATLGVSGNMSIRNNKRNQDLFYNYLNNPNLTGTSQRFSRQHENDLGYDLNLNYKQELRLKGEELTANFSFGNDSEDGVNNFEQSFTDPSGVYDRRINDTDESGNNINIQADYVRPINDKSKIEAGYRSIIRTSDESQSSQYFDHIQQTMLPDYDISNDFDMESIVHAVYSNYQNKLTEKLGFQLGLRAEQAYLNTEYVSLDPSLSPADRLAKGRLDYFRLYPSLFLTQEFGNQNQLQVSYTRRVNRPRGWQVNPFIDVSDPMNIRQGNPNLLPEDIHSFELSYAKFWSSVTLTSSAYYRRVNDVVQPIVTTLQGNSGATFSYWENISRNETTGFELISQINFTKKFDVMNNVNLFYTRFNGSTQYNIEPAEGFNWNANSTINYRILPVLSTQVRAEYQAPRIMAQGKGIETFVIDAGARLDVLNKKGSILFNVRDLLNQRKWGGYTQTNQFYRYFENRWQRRMFTLSFTYRFGNQMERENGRKKNNIIESSGDGEQF
jgi:outer membrane receptor protein involved in Fe transport